MISQTTIQPSGDWSWPFVCIECGRDYPLADIPYCCPTCGGIYDFSAPLLYAPDDPAHVGQRGLSRFQATIPLPPGATLISLGEGDTPLLDINLEGRTVYLKCEYLNPTGSFKDRGSVTLVSALATRGVEGVVEDSSGNAGSSLAAYAARAGIRAKVFVPAYASGPKQAQIRAYGAEVVGIQGPRSSAAQAVLQAAEGGVVYASHVYLPHGLAGMATVAFEIVEQLGRSPGAVMLPVGHGSLLLGMFRGFQAMVEAGVIEKPPPLIGVQARACAPIWAAHTASPLELVTEGETIAEGIRILHPLRMEAVLAAVEVSGGRMMAIDEEAIIDGRDDLSRRGFFVEPTSAVVWPALLSTLEDLQDPVVIVLTGSGFKSL